ncbi:hypothetical protein F2Q70_00018099 [Brassica cretica]|uniref:Uncharacterized protein n=1 Tax=Brassica cretica TaxID=69181 RepID=A0A8S9I5Y5_BRACR|nr:hypothetical protein F2Q70_00018099 [Brassica cretica]
MNPVVETQPTRSPDAPSRAAQRSVRESHSPQQHTGADVHVVHAPPSLPDVRRSHRRRAPSVHRREAAAAGDFPVSRHRRWPPPATGLRRLADNSVTRPIRLSESTRFG